MRLAYSEDWVDVFDKKLEQAEPSSCAREVVDFDVLKALCEIEEASIPQAGIQMMGRKHKVQGASVLVTFWTSV